MLLLSLLLACSYEVPEPGAPAPAAVEAPAEAETPLGNVAPVANERDKVAGVAMPTRTPLTADLAPWFEAARVFELPTSDAQLPSLAGDPSEIVRAAAAARLWREDRAAWGDAFLEAYAVPKGLPTVETTMEDVVADIRGDVDAIEGLEISPTARQHVTMLVGFLRYRERPEIITYQGNRMSVSRFFRSALLGKVSGAQAADMKALDDEAARRNEASADAG